jgi:hypothetical protein
MDTEFFLDEYELDKIEIGTEQTDTILDYHIDTYGDISMKKKYDKMFNKYNFYSKNIDIDFLIDETNTLLWFVDNFRKDGKFVKYSNFELMEILECVCGLKNYINEDTKQILSVSHPKVWEIMIKITFAILRKTDYVKLFIKAIEDDPKNKKIIEYDLRQFQTKIESFEHFFEKNYSLNLTERLIIGHWYYFDLYKKTEPINCNICDSENVKQKCSNCSSMICSKICFKEHRCFSK